MGGGGPQAAAASPQRSALAGPDAPGTELTDSPAGRRLDELLSAALAEQAREQAGFMRVLQSSRDALAATRMELDNLRNLVEGRDDKLVEALDARLASVAQDGSVGALGARFATLEAEQAALKRTISVKLEAVAGSLEAMEWRSQEALKGLLRKVTQLERTLGEQVSDLSSQLAGEPEEPPTANDEWLASIDARLDELTEVVEVRQQAVAKSVIDALEPVGRVLQMVQTRLASATADLVVAQGSLLARLDQRDEMLEARRDQVLADLLSAFAGNLRRRDRKKIAAGLTDADAVRRQRRDAERTPVPGPTTVTYPPRATVAPSRREARRAADEEAQRAKRDAEAQGSAGPAPVTFTAPVAKVPPMPPVDAGSPPAPRSDRPRRKPDL